MKKVVLIRHAKSSWSDVSLQDFHRPLNKRGERDAPMMANQLMAILPKLDFWCVSSAVRTKATFAYFKSAYKLKGAFDYYDDLYHASADVIEEQLTQVDETHESVALIAHNPGLTYAANRFQGIQLDHLPTCGIVIAEFDGNWNQFKLENCKYQQMIYPKMYSYE